jgi:hypothetical protein
LGIAQGGPAPDEQELVGKLKGLLGVQACSFETPALDLINRHKDEIAKLLDHQFPMTIFHDGLCGFGEVSENLFRKGRKSACEACEI